MTIRKITNRTPNLVVSSLLITAGIPRAHVSQTSLIQKIANATSSLIPKAQVTIGRLIDHILFEPGGYGNQYFYDFIFISERPGFDVGKNIVDDYTSVVENIFVNYVRGRNPADDITSEELIKLLLQTKRTFTDAVPAADRPYLLFDRAPISDAVSVDEFLLIARIHSNADEFITDDNLSRLFFAARTFDDSAGMIDAFTSIDGSTYRLDRNIREFVSVGTTAVSVDRLSGDVLENVSFVLQKYLDPDLEYLDVINFYNIKGLTDTADPIELKSLNLDKQLTDIFEPDSRIANSLLKPVVDVIDSVADLFVSTVNKLLSDTATLIDNMDLGDQLTYDSLKEFADLLEPLDFKQLDIGKFFENNADIADQYQQLVNKFRSDNFTASEIKTFDVIKGLSDSVSMLDELISLIRPYNYADEFTAPDLAALYLNKLLADTVVADDPLVRLTDGNIFYSIKNIQEAQTLTDYFARSTRTYRYPHHGFLEFTTYSDLIPKFVNLDIKTGAYTNYNSLLRINRLLVNADFENPSWDRTGTTVSANEVATPINIAAQIRNNTLDANNIAELFDGQNLWWSEVPLAEYSLADSLYEDTSTGLHNIYAVSTRSMTDNLEFSFALYVKAQSSRYIRFDISDEFHAIYDLQTSVASVVSSNSNAHVSQIGSGWWLCSLTDKFTAGPGVRSNQTVTISVLNNSLNSSYTGSGAAAFYIWGAQLELDDQVLQEISSLNFVKTGNYENSRLGYNSMPEDRDRVFVGTYLRNSDVYTTRYSGDAHELLKFWVNKAINDFAPSVDATEVSDGVLFYTIYQFTDSFSVGRTEGYKLAGDDTERTPFWFDKSARSGTTSAASIVRWERSNLLVYSEDFVIDYWVKSNSLAQKNLLLTSGNLPYRNPTVDANRLVGELEYTDYTYHENRWYDLVPRLNKPDFTSNVVTDIFENSTTSTHYISTIVNDDVQDNNLFSYSVYASPINGVSKFRLDCSDIWADFDLSSVAVTDSFGAVHADISVIDSSNLVYLCRVMGPAIRKRFGSASSNLISLQTLTDQFDRQFTASRIFEDQSAAQDTDGLDLALIIDYAAGAGAEDFDAGSGSEDYAEI